MLRHIAKRVLGPGLRPPKKVAGCAYVMIRVDEDSGKIVDSYFKTFGYDSTFASSSVATKRVKGKQMEKVLSIKNTEIVKHLSLSHCIMLAEDAIKVVVIDYEAKRAKPTGVQTASANY